MGEPGCSTAGHVDRVLQTGAQRRISRRQLRALMPTALSFNCPKCAWSETTTVRWVEANDYLLCICTHCGYQWRLDPADRAKEPPIPPDDSDVRRKTSGYVRVQNR